MRKISFALTKEEWRLIIRALGIWKIITSEKTIRSQLIDLEKALQDFLLEEKDDSTDNGRD